MENECALYSHNLDIKIEALAEFFSSFTENVVHA